VIGKGASELRALSAPSDDAVHQAALMTRGWTGIAPFRSTRRNVGTATRVGIADGSHARPSRPADKNESRPSF
jgi:hypothetical protein